MMFVENTFSSTRGRQRRVSFALERNADFSRQRRESWDGMLPTKVGVPRSGFMERAGLRRFPLVFCRLMFFRKPQPQ
jgi:hypothetical protein